MDKVFLSFEEIPIGSIWLAADGGSYGYIVTGKDLNSEDILVQGFSSKGWALNGPNEIDWFKLQYRYYLVWPTIKAKNARSKHHV